MLHRCFILGFAMIPFGCLSQAQDTTPTTSIGWRFHIFADGLVPYGGLTQSPSGTLYGTTQAGGETNGCPNGCGLVYQLTPAPPGGVWYGGPVCKFTSSADGEAPYAGVILAPDGGLYGTTQYGGVFGDGVVYVAYAGANGGECVEQVFGTSAGRDTAANLRLY